MIKLRQDINPKKATLDKLAEFQCEIDVLKTFSERSKKAEEMFKNRKNNKAFEDVKECLAKMCNSTQRCVYCEDSQANEVEHIYPKSLFPGKCFRWDNYVYACGLCNKHKGNKFAIFRDDNGQFQEVNPPNSKIPATEPPTGEAVMINPRVENPLEYFMLDLLGTFKFVVKPGLLEKAKKKADYTLNTVLRLNDADNKREVLRKGRKNAFKHYKRILSEYVSKKQQGAPEIQLQKIIEGIQGENHSTVWKEMQRYHQKGILKSIDEELEKLFEASPEALNW